MSMYLECGFLFVPNECQLPPFVERTPQDQLDTINAHYPDVSTPLAEGLVKDGTGVCLQVRIAALQHLLAAGVESEMGAKLNEFRYNLQVFTHNGWNDSLVPTSFYRDEWAHKSGDTQPARTFQGTSLGKESLADLLLKETQNGQPLAYSWIHENDRATPVHKMPYEAIKMLRHARRYTPRGGERFAELLAPVQSIASEMFDEAFKKAKAERNYRALSELCVGSDFLNEAQAYVWQQEDEEAAALEVVQTVEKVVGASEKIASCFHPELQQSVEEAFLRVGLRFIYGYNQHMRSGGDTKDELVLGPDFRLPVRLRADDPKKLLGDLFEAVDAIYDAHHDPSVMISPVTSPADFTLLRYSQLARLPASSNVQEYIRTKGAYAFDPTYEFGRRTEGVEASHSHIYTKHPFLHHAKDAENMDTISIRIDFEGIDPTHGRNAHSDKRDPTNETGTMSLDVGSILGNDKNLGVGIGRFLAWCDQLRVNSQKGSVSDDTPSFNHGYEAFPTGRQSEYTRQLQELIRDRLSDPRLVSLRELSRASLDDAMSA